MHKAIWVAKEKLGHKEYLLLIDGNYFNPKISLDQTTNTIKHEHFKCIEGGDNKYCAIAAASILAKVERDKYIEELCEQNPDLSEKYGIHKNKGYGTKQHIEGIRKYGKTDMHRLSFKLKQI